MVIRNPPLYFAPYRKKEDMSNTQYYIETRFDGNEPKNGDRVDITIPGTVVNYSSDGTGQMWVDIDQNVIENTDPDRDGNERALVVLDIKDAVPGIPNLAAGQVYMKHSRSYVVYRENPLSRGGRIVVRDALSGQEVGHGYLSGANLVYDPIN